MVTVVAQKEGSSKFGSCVNTEFHFHKQLGDHTPIYDLTFIGIVFVFR